MEATRAAHPSAGPHLSSPSSSRAQSLIERQRETSQNLLQGQKAIRRSGEQGQGNEKWIFRCLLHNVLLRILSTDTNWPQSQTEQMLWAVSNDSGNCCCPVVHLHWAGPHCSCNTIHLRQLTHQQNINTARHCQHAASKARP